MPNCNNCENSFDITKQDKEFYQSLDVPEPTWCPDCRNMRRLSIRNERTFYERTCDCCKKNIIAYYPEEAEQVVYCPECWYSDKWNPFDFGVDFDFNREFFTQFKELYKKVPTLSLDIVNCENSEYVSYCGDDKSCYFDIAGEANENCLYGKFIKYCKDCVDNSFTYNSELCYECVNCHNCYGSTWLDRCTDCDHCHSCFDLKGCSHCINCINLRNKKFCINNKEYSEAEFKKKIKNIGLRCNIKGNIIRSSYQTNSENCTGNDITNSKNCSDCFDIVNCENSKWLWDVLDAKDCYDLNFSLYKPEHSLELISTLNMTESKFCNASHYCHHMEYCDKCNNSHDCLGSIGIMKGEYVILNKKYSEEEYSELKEIIINQMKKTGEYGQFFPMGTSGFKYHETVASEYYPQDIGESGHQHVRQDSELPTCTSCKKQFKIISQEKDFYKHLKLTEPKRCPECRHKNRNIRAGARSLYDRTCIKCKKVVKSPLKIEKIYCEKCYNKVIY